MAEGWIKISRKLFNHPVWLNSSLQTKIVLMAILGHACYQPMTWDVLGQPITLRPGQLYASESRLLKWCGKGTTRQGVRTALARLEKMNFITKQTTNCGTLVTVVNWDKYQGYEYEEQPTEEPKNNQRTTNEQPTESKKQPTNKKEYTLKRKQEGKKVRIIDIIASFAGENSALTESINGWVEMRKKNHKPLTAHALELNLKKLYKLTNGNEREMISIVDQSTMSGWQSFYPLKGEKKQEDSPADFYSSIIAGRDGYAAN